MANWIITSLVSFRLRKLSKSPVCHKIYYLNHRFCYTKPIPLNLVQRKRRQAGMVLWDSADAAGKTLVISATEAFFMHGEFLKLSLR